MKERKTRQASRTEPADGAARKVVTPRNQWKKGIVNCPLLPAPVHHESALEKSFIQRAILCLMVEFIRHQPYRVARHTLDFELGVGDVKIAVEVKLAKKVRNYIAVFNNTAARLAEKGIPFYVITEGEIRADHRDEHAAEILRYAKTQVDFEEHARVLDALALNGAMTAERLQEAARVDAQTLQHLVARRLLTCEPTLVVESRSVISITPPAEDPIALFERYFGIRPWVIQEEPIPVPRKPDRALKRRPKRKGPILRDDTAHDRSAGMRLIAGGAPSL